MALLSRLNSSLSIGTYLGIPVKIHWTFPLVFVYIIVIGLQGGLDWKEIVFLALITVLVFCSVLLHEYGHALMARRYGVHTQDIIIAPIGGVARLSRIPQKPVQEIMVALAGPLVNVVIAGLLFATIYFGNLPLLAQIEDYSMIYNFRFLPGTLMMINIVLVIFNMIPAFPMDGGRVLRSLLAIKLNRVKATWIASLIGQLFAFGFIFYGMTNDHWSLLLIGFFVMIAARGEYRTVKTEDIVRSHTMAEVLAFLRSKSGANLESIDPYFLNHKGLGIESTMNIQDAYHLYKKNRQVHGINTITVYEGSEISGYLDLPEDLNSYLDHVSKNSSKGFRLPSLFSNRKQNKPIIED